MENNSAKVQSLIAAAVGIIASIEFPRQEWLDLINIIVNTAQHQQPSIRKTSMVLVINVADEVEAKYLNDEQRYMFIDAIMRNLVYDPANVEVAKMALKGFLNSLKYADKLFATEAERNVIMQKLFEAYEKLKDDQDSMVTLMNIFQDIATKHYDYVQFYLKEFATITGVFAKQGDEEVAPQALEFWSNLAEVEIDRR